MPDYKTKYTNRQGKVIPALADIEYKGKAPSDTIVYLSPQVPGADFHKIILSGPDSKYYRFENADGTFYPNDEYKDYYVSAARQAVKNAQPRSTGEKIKYGLKRLFSFQQGGAAPQQNIQQQVKQLVQAAAQGNKEASAQIQQIVNAAKQGNQQAIQILELIQQEIQALQMARKGAKLNYLKSLKGDCPEGEEVVYFQKGGTICKKCEKKKQETLKKTNSSSDVIEEFKKGRKTKKC